VFVKVGPAEEVRRIILAAMANWSALNADANTAYYTAGDNAVFFDFCPMKYAGWENYRNEINRISEGIQKFQMTLNDDLTVHCVGKMAWASATWTMDFHYKDGTTRHLDGRLTEVLERQRGKWQIVHEHSSVPTTA
jgi:ketosteroid isomerase-like protein